MTDLSPSAANGAARDTSYKGDPPIADITARPSTNDTKGLTERLLSDSLASAVKDAKAKFDVKAQALTEQARTTLATLRSEAEKRGAQGVEMVREKPYAAIGAAVLAGFLIGHLMSASRPQVVYLKDHR
jgi:ElaB/YqjD/DUF883 family membrane-anchored ribosome-binding protein